MSKAGSMGESMKNQISLSVADVATNSNDNANLIAAAPELLEALKRIIEWDDTGCDPSRAVLQAARAIIAKAEGKGVAMKHLKNWKPSK